MSIETIWEDFTSSEKHLFQKSCRRLLKQTFLVRDKDEDYKKMYYFVAKRQEVFEQYFSFIGFDIVLDRENGVVMLRNSAEFGENGKLQGNRLALKKAESLRVHSAMMSVNALVLCCLWTLYVDRLRSGSLAQTITVSITDLGFTLEKYGLKEPLDKTLMANILKLFSRYNLIEVKGKVGEPDCLIRLYASLQFALDTEEFKKFVEVTEKKMMEKEDTETEEDADDAE